MRELSKTEVKRDEQRGGEERSGGQRGVDDWRKQESEERRGVGSAALHKRKSEV